MEIYAIMFLKIKQRRKQMDIFSLYEDLKKHMENGEQYDELFYDAPEGEAQIDIVKEMLQSILENL